jgi:hypothetical protein
MKPIELVERAIRNSSKSRDIVLDPFGGSGSTRPARAARYLRLSTPTDGEIAAGAKCPAGYVHLPNGTEAEWLKQPVGEQLVAMKTKRGRLEWQKLRERNEALDPSCICTCGGLDRRRR